MKDINDEPAFPTFYTTGSLTEQGMTLRDYFAAKAMQAIVIGNNADISVMGSGCAIDSYALADAMLAERAK